MKQSRFDVYVNKILKESLASGNYNTTSVTPAKPSSQTPINRNQKQDQQENQQQQIPIPDNQPAQQQKQTNTNNGDGNIMQSINALINQMKENDKKEDDFQKKLIATQTAVNKNVTTTPATTQASSSTNVLGTGNLDIKQILGNLGVK